MAEEKEEQPLKDLLAKISEYFPRLSTCTSGEEGAAPLCYCLPPSLPLSLPQTTHFWRCAVAPCAASPSSSAGDW